MFSADFSPANQNTVCQSLVEQCRCQIWQSEAGCTHSTQRSSPPLSSALRQDAVWAASAWRRGWWKVCRVPQSPSPAHTAWHHRPKALRGSVKWEDEAALNARNWLSCHSSAEDTDLGKDELCCKVKIVIQLFSFINNSSFDFQKALHRVLQCLAVGMQKAIQRLRWKNHQPNIDDDSLLCVNILRCSLMLVVQPSNLEKYIRLY